MSLLEIKFFVKNVQKAVLLKEIALFELKLVENSSANVNLPNVVRFINNKWETIRCFRSNLCEKACSTMVFCLKSNLRQ